jgi:hypothetical protein
MRRLILILALFVVAVGAGRPFAQGTSWDAPRYGWGSGWCSTCYVRVNVDTPTAQSAYNGTFSGWAFMEANSLAPDRIDLYVDGVYQSGATVYLATYRHDVGLYTGNDYEGWTVIPAAPLTSGTHAITLTFFYQAVATAMDGTVVVP